MLSYAKIITQLKDFTGKPIYTKPE